MTTTGKRDSRVWGGALVALGIVALAALALRGAEPSSSGATWTLLVRTATAAWEPGTFARLKAEGRRARVYVRKLGPGAAERASVLVLVDEVDGARAIVRVTYDEAAGFARRAWMPPAGHRMPITTAEIVGVT